MIIIYRFLYFILAPLVLLLALFNQKVRQGLKLRMQPKPKMVAGKHPIWFHCASGEFEYARGVIRELKQESPQATVLVTYFSPTYRKTIENDPLVDICLPLPLDLPGSVMSFLKRYRPKLLLIAKTDLWPEVLIQCRYYKIPTILFSRVEKAEFSKFKFSHQTQKWLLSLVDQVYCMTEDDRHHLKSFGIDDPVVLGDTRFDQAWYRLKVSKWASLPEKVDRCIMVAGSTWKEDEAVLLPAVSSFIKSNQIKLFIAPHEPTKSHLNNLEKHLNHLGLYSQRYSAVKDQIDFTSNKVIIVDEMGILADLYQWSALAFVGGSFKKSVHSVMEPLCAGNVTLVGPLVKNNREAQIFSQIHLVPALNMVSICKDQTQFENALTQFLLNPSGYKALIKEQIQVHKGASKKILSQIQTFLK